MIANARPVDSSSALISFFFCYVIALDMTCCYVVEVSITIFSVPYFLKSYCCDKSSFPWNPHYHWLGYPRPTELGIFWSPSPKLLKFQFSTVCRIRNSRIHSDDMRHCTHRCQSVTGVPCMPEAVVDNGEHT